MVFRWILYGEKGSGKSLMCQKMFEYGQDAGIIPEQALLQKYKVLEQDMQLAEQAVGNRDQKKGCWSNAKAVFSTLLKRRI